MQWPLQHIWSSGLKPEDSILGWSSAHAVTYILVKMGSVQSKVATSHEWISKMQPNSSAVIIWPERGMSPDMCCDTAELWRHNSQWKKPGASQAQCATTPNTWEAESEGSELTPAFLPGYWITFKISKFCYILPQFLKINKNTESYWNLTCEMLNKKNFRVWCHRLFVFILTRGFVM